MSNFPGNPFGFGFVYFNNSSNNTSDPNGSNDYLEFSNTESPGQHFSPSNSSSPNQFRQRNFRGNRGNKSYNRNRYNSNNDYSYDSMNYSGSSNKNSPNFRNQSNFRSKPQQNTYNISQYYHPSMVEDPWFHLEQSQDLINQDDNSKKNITDQDTFDSTTEDNNYDDNDDSD